MRFSDTVKHLSPALVVSQRHDAWLARNSNPVYSDAALDFMREQLDAVPRERRASFSASSLGSCLRAQQFTFLGLPQLRPEPRGASIFHNGTFMHLRWQMAGITEGWLSEPEVAVPADNALGLKGTMDGVLYEGSVLELKSINDNGFRSVISFGPQKKHKLQGASYLSATGKDKVVFIYENKNDQEYREYVLTADELSEEMAQVASRTDVLGEKTSGHELFPPLSKCIDREGFDYKFCQFRHVCLGVKEYDDAVRQAG